MARPSLCAWDKDYRDIAALLTTGSDLPTGLAAARALYGNAFQPSDCLKALVYFKGAICKA